MQNFGQRLLPFRPTAADGFEPVDAPLVPALQPAQPRPVRDGLVLELLVDFRGRLREDLLNPIT